MEGSGYQSGLFSATHNTSGEGEGEGAGGVLLEDDSPSPSSTPSQTPSPPPPDSAAAGSSYDMMRGVVMGLAPPALAPPAGETIGNINMMSSVQGNMGFNSSSNISTSATATATATATPIDEEVQAISGKKTSPYSSSLPLFTPLSTLAPTGNSNNTTISTLLSYSDLSSEKRTRGRPPGSGKRQLLATLGEWFAYSAGGNFTPHVVTIAAGEDVAARIMSFSQKGPRGICILSANGAISNVTLRQPGSSGGTLTYEGRFEILSLSGSFTITENSGVRSRTGGISVSLAGPDGRVVGGGVAGLLLAASPIQVVVGSFLPNILKEHRKRSNPESQSFSPVPAAAGGILTAARPISQVNPGDDCEIPTSTLRKHNHGESECSRIASLNPNPNSVTFHQTLGRQVGLQESSWEHKPSPDINLSLPGE